MPGRRDTEMAEIRWQIQSEQGGPPLKKRNRDKRRPQKEKVAGDCRNLSTT